MSHRKDEARRQKEKEARSRQKLQEQAYRETQKSVYDRIYREQDEMPDDYEETLWQGEGSPSGKKKKRGRIVLYTVLLMLLALAGAALAAHAALVHRPALPEESTEPATAEEEAPAPVDGARREDVYTFLLVGRDDKGGGNTDTIMVGCFDAKNGALDVLSIFRDTLVDVPWEIKKINSVYNNQGIEGLQAQIKNLIGYQPDYYFVVELSAVVQLVDAIGGVDFDVPYNMNYDDPTQNLHIHLQKGMQHLNGEDAVRLLRWRKNNSGESLSVGDIGRVEIQHDFLKAMAEQTIRLGNITKIRQIASIVDKNLTTDLTYGEILWFGEQALGMEKDNIHFYSLPGDYTGTIWSPTYQNYQSYVFVNPTALLELVNQHMNPFNAPIRAEDQHVIHGTSENNQPTLPADTGLPIIQQGSLTGSENELPTGALQPQTESNAVEIDPNTEKKEPEKTETQEPAPAPSAQPEPEPEPETEQPVPEPEPQTDPEPETPPVSDPEPVSEPEAPPVQAETPPPETSEP